ncbi:MAG TPA: site-2 protease family protein, partial [Burkholderiales bacterium]|nr:site-2 protease family protein [Burkholderiales bacterium]
MHTVIAFIVALGVLIVVHEYGHYLVAKLCRVKVLRFSVGFGRPLLVRRLGRDRTEWVIAAIPFGGYVKMLDEREGPVPPEEAERAFNRQSVGKRFLIVVAGPLFNFMFAVLVYAGLFMYGLPEAKPVLAAPPAG